MSVLKITCLFITFSNSHSNKRSSCPSDTPYESLHAQPQSDICYIFIIWDLGDDQPEKLTPGVHNSNTELVVLLKTQSISSCLILK